MLSEELFLQQPHLCPQPQHHKELQVELTQNSKLTSSCRAGDGYLRSTPGNRNQGTHGRQGWKHLNVGGHDFTSCILQSWVFYCNYVLATNCRRGKWLRVLLSLRIQHKSHRAAVAEMMKYLYCCFSITGVSWHKKRFPCIALMCKCALIRAAGTWSHIQEEKQLAGHFLFTYL